MLLVWCFTNEYFVVDYVFYNVVYRLYFLLFLFVAILFFVIFHFAIIAFILVIFVLIVIWFFFPDSITTYFLVMFWLIAVMAFWYIHTLFMTTVLSLVPIFPTSLAGTLILIFYIEGVFIFSWTSCYWLFDHLVKIYRKIVTYPLNIYMVVFIIYLIF